LDVETIVAKLKQERDRLNQAIVALQGLSARVSAKRSAVRRKKKRTSPTTEGRKRAAVTMKKQLRRKRKKGDWAGPQMK